eukprot:19638_2
MPAAEPSVCAAAAGATIAASLCTALRSSVAMLCAAPRSNTSSKSSRSRKFLRTLSSVSTPQSLKTRERRHKSSTSMVHCMFLTVVSTKYILLDWMKQVTPSKTNIGSTLHLFVTWPEGWFLVMCRKVSAVERCTVEPAFFVSSVSPRGEMMRNSWIISPPAVLKGAMLRRRGLNMEIVSN